MVASSWRVIQFWIFCWRWDFYHHNLTYDMVLLFQDLNKSCNFIATERQGAINVRGICYCQYSKGIGLLVRYPYQQQPWCSKKKKKLHYLIQYITWLYNLACKHMLKVIYAPASGISNTKRNDILFNWYLLEYQINGVDSTSVF